MRAFTVNTKVALPTEAPFLPGYTVVVANFSATAETLQSGETLNGAYDTIAVVPASSAVEVVLNKPFVQIEDGSGILVLLAN